MLVKTYGSAIMGIEAITVTIEVSISMGVNFFLVGLPDSVVKESQQRIEAALQTVGLRLPGKKIVINMAPADIRKEGSAYDLPLAIGILAASEQISINIKEKVILLGELSLDGQLQPIKGALPIALQAKQEDFDAIILPKQNAAEAVVVDGLKVYGVNSLLEVIDILQHDNLPLSNLYSPSKSFEDIKLLVDDFSDIKGQEQVKRALEIAAAGGHNLIMIGPPGSGKTMLAKRLSGILPPMTLQESLETTKIHSVAGKIPRDFGLITQRPFRAPHHVISDVALSGGGSYPHPGEISLAHHGVLFLDELPEFKRSVLELMRQPLEDREITISRAKYTVTYPASFMLIASMNPCPCGYYNHPDKDCVCPPGAVHKYLHKISGPLLDRIDIHIEVTPVPFDKLSSIERSETSQQVRKRVVAARQIQTERFKKESQIYCNAQMRSKQLQQYCRLNPDSLNLLRVAVDKLGFSARAYDRILKVARTIADLDNSDTILSKHISEAIHYRSLDRETWGQ